MSVCVEGQIANRVFDSSFVGGGVVDLVRLEVLHLLSWSGEGKSRRLGLEEVRPEE